MNVRSDYIRKAYETWHNGNRRDAAKMVRSFNRCEILRSVGTHHTIMLRDPGMTRAMLVQWEDFIESAIEERV